MFSIQIYSAPTSCLYSLSNILNIEYSPKTLKVSGGEIIFGTNHGTISCVYGLEFMKVLCRIIQILVYSGVRQKGKPSQQTWYLIWKLVIQFLNLEKWVVTSEEHLLLFDKSIEDEYETYQESVYLIRFCSFPILECRIDLFTDSHSSFYTSLWGLNSHRTYTTLSNVAWGPQQQKAF